MAEDGNNHQMDKMKQYFRNKLKKKNRMKNWHPK